MSEKALPKILIVDDSQSNLFSLESLITEDIDTEIIKAESGQMALQILQQQQVDLVILDVQMPEMDGFETAQLIRSQENTQHLPILFITAAYDTEEFQQKGFSIENMDYLTKPFNPEKLISIIQSHLS